MTYLSQNLCIYLCYEVLVRRITLSSHKITRTKCKSLIFLNKIIRQRYVTLVLIELLFSLGERAKKIRGQWATFVIHLSKKMSIKFQQCPSGKLSPLYHDIKLWLRFHSISSPKPLLCHIWKKKSEFVFNTENHVFKS